MHTDTRGLRACAWRGRGGEAGAGGGLKGSGLGEANGVKRDIFNNLNNKIEI